jgi:RNA polymerase sigma factor (sigma-70 family)
LAESLELLVRAARRGDAAALSDLLARYRERLLARVRLMMGAEARRQAESDDFLQATLLAVVEHIQRLDVRDERAFLRWMTTIARNRICDTVRRQRERSRCARSRIRFPGDERPALETPSNVVSDQETSLRLIEALESLEPTERAVVELRDLEGLVFREVGARLGFDEDARATCSPARAAGGWEACSPRPSGRRAAPGTSRARRRTCGCSPSSTGARGACRRGGSPRPSRASRP